MPTLVKARRRGYSPESIREFCDRVGVAKRNNVIDVGLLELLHETTNAGHRAMAMLQPLKWWWSTIRGQIEWLPAVAVRGCRGGHA